MAKSILEHLLKLSKAHRERIRIAEQSVANMKRIADEAAKAGREAKSERE
ncbi:unnamed protein product [marine sediment metagenome]|uniref:Uncharacterized protein n=1 Tax=marine sediment metagenome TaxID=412755 RepID=X1U9M2_9ZZZZ